MNHPVMSYHALVNSLDNSFRLKVGQDCSPGGVRPHLVEVEGVEVATGGYGASDGVAEGAAPRARLNHHGPRPQLQLQHVIASSHVFSSFNSGRRLGN